MAVAHRQSMRNLTLLFTLSTAALVGCGGQPEPTSAEVEDAQGRVQAAVKAGERIRSALELLGILPVYECGEARPCFVGRALEGARAQVGCATVAAESRGPTADAIVLSFPQDCSAAGHSVT